MTITGREPVVVLITVNDHETDALLNVFLGPGQPPVPASWGGVTYHDLGLHGGLRVIHSLCEMGAGGIGAAQQRTQDAIEHWKPQAIIAVGIAFGIDETKQQIGDVLVSVQLQDYELARVNADETLTPRSDKAHATDTLVNRFRQTDVRCRRSEDAWPKVRFGLVLSGQKLVDNLDYRESLKRLGSETIGGEMEGSGLYTSAQRAGVDWLVVKAICDWGHNKNQADKDTWQKIAAANAARVVKAALAAGDLYPLTAAEPLDGKTRSNSDLSVPAAPKLTRKIAGTQLEKHAPRVLFGREAELAALDEAWAQGTLNVYTLVAWGGAGKTSLVFHWVQTRFAAKGWLGVERYFDWSFYSQGTGESRQTSADLFIAKALEFFGDPDPTVGGPHERGERLAGLIRRHRTLLILDGIEPLQYPPNDPQAGRLKDPALETLLRELAADNPGLVVITTREHLRNIEGHATTEEQKLDKLAKDAAVALLRHLQIVGSDEELHAAWKDAGGHALTLSLLGRFIADAYEDRDIRHYKEVKFEEADQEHQGRSAFKVMIAYERWLQSGGPERQRELAVLRLTGLFDRPMVKSCLQALRAEPVIPGLTDGLVKLTPQQWNIAVKRLSEVELLSVSPDAIDAHPLIREYFAAQLKRDQAEAFREAHSRLFDYLCESTPHHPDGIDGLAPLYEAVTHGCLAGRQQEACDKVYHDRILRGGGGNGFYSTNKLGAIGANLAAVAAFFDVPWSRVSPNLAEPDQAWLLGDAAYFLRAVGRLTEALQPMRAGLEILVQQKVWKSAAIIASNLSELEVTLGRLPDAVTDARQSVTYADQSGDAGGRVINRTTAADALHQSGQRDKARELFAEAERMQQADQPEFDLLYSARGFQYCDWLLAPAEQAAWQALIASGEPHGASRGCAPQPSRHEEPAASALPLTVPVSLAEVERRAKAVIKRRTGLPSYSLLDIALDHLTLARVGLIRAILANPLPQPTLDLPHVAAAVNGLRDAGTTYMLPLGLLTAALYHFVRSEYDLAEKDLAEAQQIAERGPMPLFLADIHLTRARFAGSLKGEGGSGKWDAKAELAQAGKLIHELGYRRRDQELADAESAIESGTA